MLIKLDKLKEKYNIQANGVLHIGASEGQEAEAYNQCGIKKMIWIEAIPNIFMNLKQKISRYPDAIAINACLSDEDGKDVDFNISSNNGESSSFLEFGIHREMHPSVTFIDKLQLKTARFDTIAEQMNLNLLGYDFLNIDVQGAEMHVLRGMGETLKNFKYAYIEVNKAEVYKGCGRVEEVDVILAKYGLVGVEERMVDGKWGDKFYIHESLLNKNENVAKDKESHEPRATTNDIKTEIAQPNGIDPEKFTFYLKQVRKLLQKNDERKATEYVQKYLGKNREEAQEFVQNIKRG